MRKGERESEKEREGETCGREWEKEKYSFLKRKLQYSYSVRNIWGAPTVLGHWAGSST